MLEERSPAPLPPQLPNPRRRNSSSLRAEHAGHLSEGRLQQQCLGTTFLGQLPLKAASERSRPSNSYKAHAAPAPIGVSKRSAPRDTTCRCTAPSAAT